MAMADFGDKLREWRKVANLLQKEAAEVLGVSVRTYQAWEERGRTPNSIMQCELERRMQNHKPNENT